MSPTWSRVFFSLLGVPLTAAAWYMASLGCERQFGPLPKPGQRGSFPDFTLPDLDGQSWSLSAHRGSVVLVNFWGSSCSPCLAEIPGLARLSRRFEGRGLRLVGIAMDPSPSDAVPAVVARYRIPYPTLTCYPLEENPEGRGRPECAFGRSVDSVPLTLLLDRAGRVARTYHGAASASILEKDIRKLLDEP